MKAPYKIWDIPGGIHPADRKSLSSSEAIRRLPLPDRVILPLNQHIGAPAEALVSVGDTVKTGQLVARNASEISACIHSPVTGTVTGVQQHPVPHPSGLDAACIIIERATDRDERFDFLPPLPAWKDEKADFLRQRILNAGITGLGGAGFPTHAKFGSRNRIDTLIINGVECEPYITADDRLMREKAAEIVEGIQISLYMLEAEQALIGIEDNKPEAVEAIENAIKKAGDKRLSVRVVPTKYPSGGEKQLIQLLTGKEVRAAAIPAAIGIVVQNVGTVFAMQQAVTEGRPLIERVVTVTGENAGARGNWWVRIGTPIAEVLTQTGNTDSRKKLIMGGPLMGFSLRDTAAPVIKATNCLLMPQEQPQQPVLPCIRCGQCEQACPVSLLPQQLYWNSRNHEWEKAELNNINDCIECGACAWSCPSNIPLVQHYRFAKAEIRREYQEKEKSDRARLRFEQKQARLAAEQAEKEAKRKARAEAAAKAQAKMQEEGKKPAIDNSAREEILAAVARSKARKAASAAVENGQKLSPEQLKEKWDGFEKKVSVARQKLEQAKEEGSPTAAALEKAMGKLEEKRSKAQADYEAACNGSEMENG